MSSDNFSRSIQQKQRLEQKRATLQAEWNLRSEKLKELRRALAIESGIAVKFQLEQQIQDEETQLEQLESKLDAIEQSLNLPETQTEKENTPSKDGQIQPQVNYNIAGDYIAGDKMMGDKVGGDKIVNASGQGAVAIGGSATDATIITGNNNVIADLPKKPSKLENKSIGNQTMSSSVPNSDYEYDVFISYSSKDRNWVKNVLLAKLEAEGLTACIDFRDFTLGMPTVKNIEQAVIKSRKTLLVMSDNYTASGWTEFENIMLQTLDPANQELRLIPLMYQRCQLPVRISMLTYLNLATPEDEEVEWERLLRAIKFKNNKNP